MAGMFWHWPGEKRTQATQHSVCTACMRSARGKGILVQLLTFESSKRCIHQPDQMRQVTLCCAATLGCHRCDKLPPVQAGNQRISSDIQSGNTGRRMYNSCSTALHHSPEVQAQALYTYGPMSIGDPTCDLTDSGWHLANKTKTA